MKHSGAHVFAQTLVLLACYIAAFFCLAYAFVDEETPSLLWVGAAVAFSAFGDNSLDRAKRAVHKPRGQDDGN